MKETETDQREHPVHEAIRELLEFRKRHRLGPDLSVRDLIREGRDD